LAALEKPPDVMPVDGQVAGRTDADVAGAAGQGDVADDQGVHVARIPVFVVAGDDAMTGHERKRRAVLGPAGAVARPADAGAVRPLGQTGELLAAVPGEQAL
jgi:hypothetical protein